MKKLTTLLLLIIFCFIPVLTVSAQGPESIWIQSNAAAYKTNEVVTVTINGASATPIQGFTAQIRYDPACLQPVDSTSPISGMNGLNVPQESGLADVSFASTTPQTVNGELAAVRFTALQGCQTSLVVETAALVVRDGSGFAVPVSGINVDHNALLLNIDNAAVESQPVPSGGSSLPLVPGVASRPKTVPWSVIILVAIMVVALIAFIIILVSAKPAKR